MSTPNQPDDPAAPGRPPAKPDIKVDPVVPPTRPTAKPRPAREPRRRGGGTAALALLLALVALVAAGYLGWQEWQRQRSHATEGRSVAALQQRVDALDSKLGTLADNRQDLDKRLDDADHVNRSLREELLGQSDRLRHLEDAVARLTRSSLSGHDAMKLDEAESLLRMAAERYTLFHDAQGAAAAYTLADQTLAQVNDARFSGLRQTIDAERNALSRSQPASQSSALDTLSTLRDQVATLPLKPLDRPQTRVAPDAWSRIGHALGAVVSVHRDNGAPLAVADARFARELVALDLAQAQAALLAHDTDAYAAALQRARNNLQRQFDTAAAKVQQALASLKQLPAALPANTTVELGGALKQLRDLRAVDTAAEPATTGSAAAPAATGSTAVPAAAASAGGAMP